ncbi:MAG: hypothetical protein NZ853_09985 [Leptospiraceae bacterium]|nr:hypothetical protein [Leptospiraceae bacterium]MDW7977020.1 hypothetical protein [Leptospiraceae bacterium]
MKLYINEMEIPYTLENEKTLSDVVEALSKNLLEKNLYILDYYVELHDENQNKSNNNKDVLIDDVEALHFIVGNSMDLVRSSLESHLEFLDRLGTKIFFLEEIPEKEHQEIQRAFQWIKESLPHIVKKLDVDVMFSYVEREGKIYHLKEVFEALEENLAKLPHVHPKELTSWKNEVLSLLRVVRVFINQNYLNLLANYYTNEELVIILSNMENEIDDWMKAMVSINEYIQIGEDLKAFHTIEKLMNEMELKLFLFSVAFERSSLSDDEKTHHREVLSSLLRNFHQIAQTLENTDFVILGDTFEYEMIPLLMELKNIIPEIKKTLT